MGVMTETSEFSYLPGQAQALSLPVPSAERLSLTLPDGRELSALHYGDGVPAITLLHGAGLNAHTWDNTALLLQQPVLVIDLAGHGDSSWRDDADYTAHTLAPDVALALEAWTSKPQILVGQSLGGLTAAAVASTHPELVRELIVVDITPGIDTSGGPAALRAFYEGPTDFATRDELVDRAMALGFGGTRPETERGVFLNTRVRTDGRVEWKHHFAHLAAKALSAPTPESGVGWADLAGVSAPLTLVRATRGFVSEADAEELKRRVPDARIVAIDATHNVQETAPAELAELIRAAADAVG
ncbi:alpha/beta fold hydrolase [Microbacterium aerolatum]|uniref:Alpha/beta hydrolase n=1 Tax=Microbacterium aerolatum TaxID=153731 RepID=A0A511AA13_9MICO|nr:alpha/beta hydrolase [Microbacterium aerolatum]GEK85029.1 alpha/beta hydrolase [Microbacterium aerolatum]GGB38128.1 alpha/beta hydrolase [Microbacterium aerolatum]